MSLNDFIYAVNVFFLFYMFTYSVIYFFTTLFSAITLEDFQARKELMGRTSLNNEYNYIPITIVVPAYNEEVTIIDSIESLLHLDYPQYEIIVVNDGSSDNTLDKVIKHYNLKKVKKPYRRLVDSKDALAVYENEEKVKLIIADKDNGGKSDALNLGINLSAFPMFLCVDADSIIKKNGLKKIVEPFLEDDKMVAVGGNIKVSNGVTLKNGEVVKAKKSNKLIVNLQKIEYIRVFLNSRIAFNGINANLIISGAFGLYRKQAVVNVGGYTNGLMGEDMEIIVKIHSFYRKNNLEYKTSYVADAICYTQVPESLRVLKNQRRRWHVGLGQSLKMHKYMLFNPKYGVVGMISFPYFFLFEYLAHFLGLLGLVVIIISVLLDAINLYFFFFYILMYIGYNILISFISIILDRYLFHNEDNATPLLSMFLYSIIEGFGYNQMVSLFRVGNIFKSNKKAQWGEMERVESSK